MAPPPSVRVPASIVIGHACGAEPRQTSGLLSFARTGEHQVSGELGDYSA